VPCARQGSEAEGGEEEIGGDMWVVARGTGGLGITELQLWWGEDEEQVWRKAENQLEDQLYDPDCVWFKGESRVRAHDAAELVRCQLPDRVTR